MALYIFTDLDDTLFQTRGKCPEQADLSTIALDKQGQPLSFATGPQRTLLDWLHQGVMIPVTGRNTAALERVNLTFQSFKITSHGAMVVGPDGYPDGQWLDNLRQHHAWEQWQRHLQDVLLRIDALRQQQSLALRCRIIEDQGLACYLSVKGEAWALDQVAAEHLWDPTLVHRNGENMALLPGYASKANAVAFVLKRLNITDGSALTLALGDSLTDLPFMQLCDYAMVPRRSQIQEQLWS